MSTEDKNQPDDSEQIEKIIEQVNESTQEDFESEEKLEKFREYLENYGYNAEIIKDREH